MHLPPRNGFDGCIKDEHTQDKHWELFHECGLSLRRYPQKPKGMQIWYQGTASTKSTHSKGSPGLDFLVTFGRWNRTATGIAPRPPPALAPAHHAFGARKGVLLLQGGGRYYREIYNGQLVSSDSRSRVSRHGYVSRHVSNIREARDQKGRETSPGD